MRSHHALLATMTAAALAGCSGSLLTDPATGEAEAEAEVAAEAEEEAGRRWITIGADAIDTAREALARGATGAGVAPIEIGGGAALIEVDASDLKLLSEAMHEHHHRCGGFVLHADQEDGRASLRASMRAAAPSAAAQAAFAPSYTLNSAAAVNALLPALSEANILSLIQQLSARPTRYYTSATGIEASTWLRDKWASYATARPDVRVELFTHPAFAQKSVIATIPGTTKASEVIVIGGHLDSVSSGGGNAPGADDDASGIATLSEVFRVLVEKGFRPERTIKFMAYAAEEVGLRGSRGIVADVQARQQNVVGVLQLDMTNYKGSQRDIYLITDFTNAAQNTFVGSLIDTYVGATWGTDVCGYGCSDHAAWHEAGYPASMPAEARFADTNPNIHTVNDTLGASGNSAAHALKFAKLAAAFAAELGEGGVGPANAAPSVTITKPAAGQTVGTKVELAGSASDTEDGAISDRLAWTSSVDGALGTFSSKTVTLSPGAHTITASVVDSGGAQAAATAAVTIEVGAGGGDDGVGGGCAAGGGAGGAGALAGAGAVIAGALLRRRRRRP